MNYYDNDASWLEDDEDEQTAEQQPADADRAEVVKNYLLEKYKKAANDTEARDARESARNADIWTMGLEGLGQIASANSLARTGMGIKRGDLQGVRDVFNKRAGDAEQARKDRMQNVLQEDQLEWTGKERASKEQEWSRKSSEWSREDALKRREDDPTSEESKMYQALAAKMMPGKDFSNASATQLKGSVPVLEKMFNAEQSRLMRQDAMNAQSAAREEARKDREEARREREADRREQREKKEDDFQASIRVDDAEVKEGFRPTQKDADTAKKGKTARDGIISALNELDAIYKRSGTNLVGEDAARQEALEQQIIMHQKELDNLGVLQGRDEALVRQAMPDSTGLWENIKGFFGQDRYGAKTDQYRQNVERQYDSTLGARGYQRDDGQRKKKVIDNKPGWAK